MAKEKKPKFKVGDKVTNRFGVELEILAIGPTQKLPGATEYTLIPGRPFQYLVEQNGKNFWFVESTLK